MEQLYTLPEIASFLRLTPGTIRNLVYQRRIPFLRAGGRLRFFKSDIIQWLYEPRNSLGKSYKSSKGVDEVQR